MSTDYPFSYDLYVRKDLWHDISFLRVSNRQKLIELLRHRQEAMDSDGHMQQHPMNQVLQHLRRLVQRVFVFSWDILMNTTIKETGQQTPQMKKERGGCWALVLGPRKKGALVV